MATSSRPLIDVEKELSIAVTRAGGCRVDSITGPKPGHKIADFLFDSYGVVAELKCLEKDQINSPEFVEKVSDVYIRHAKSDKSLPRVFGTVQMTTERMSPEFQLKIAELYAAPVRRVIAAAEEQIAVTKDKLGRPQHSGVLLLVNEANSALHPQHVLWTLGQTLRNEQFPSINHVIFFTVSMGVDLPSHRLPQHVRNQGMGLNVWYSGGRKDARAIDRDFEPAFRAAWFAHLKELVGKCEQFYGTPEAFDDARNESGK